jgi:hypothetical protein
VGFLAKRGKDKKLVGLFGCRFFVFQAIFLKHSA